MTTTRTSGFSRRKLWLALGLGGLVVLTVLFLLFRPDKLWVDDTVDESLADAFVDLTIVSEEPADESGSEPLAEPTEPVPPSDPPGPASSSNVDPGNDTSTRVTDGLDQNFDDISAGPTDADTAVISNNQTNTDLDDDMDTDADTDPDNDTVTVTNPNSDQDTSSSDGSGSGPDTGQATDPSPTISLASTTSSTTTTVPQPVRLGSGPFSGIGHRAEGTAAIYQQGEVSVLRFEDDTDIQNGPDLYVWLVADTEYVRDDGTPEEFIDLGKIKGNVGGQNYILPPEFDPDRHQAVLIWCLRFSTPFATAPLA